MAFLGEQPPERVGEAVDAARACAGKAAPFELALSAPGTFSERGKTRVLWLGANPSPAEALAGELRGSLAARGFPREKLPFKAHVSLGRARTQRGAAELEAELQRLAAESPPMPRSAVSELVLFESRLGPDGARHLPLERLALGAGR